MMINYEIFKSKPAFYLGMGIFGSGSIVAIVAAINEKTFLSSFADMRMVLAEWSLLVGSESQTIVVAILGYSAAILILSIFAYTLDFLGDMTLPRLSFWCRDFGKPRVGWSFAEHDGDWNKSKYNYRQIKGINGDRQRWEIAKLGLGKASVRFFRTTFYLTMLLLIAGVIDIVSDNTYQDRGIFFVVAGVIIALLSIALWAARHEQYVLNLMSGLDQKTLPQSYSRAIKA